jgi:hypothetical protein
MTSLARERLVYFGLVFLAVILAAFALGTFITLVIDVIGFWAWVKEQW